MSLTKLLPVGKSFFGIRGEKSPYEMRKEELLPIFEAKPKFAPQRVESLDTRKAKSPPVAEGSGTPKKRRRSWLNIFTFGLLGGRGPAGPLVQSEMKLESVRVCRNELLDSDLELVIKKKRTGEGTAKTGKPVVSGTEHGWSRVASRLFEINK